jgi:hypothetical protein
MGLNTALQATDDAIQEKYRGNATTSNVVDDMQQMPMYKNRIIFSDPDIKDLFVTRVENYLAANHNGNKRQFNKTIAAQPVESQIPSAPHRTSNTIRTQFQNLQDLQEYLCIPPTRQIWDPLFFQNPTVDVIKTRWPNTSNAEVTRSRLTQIFTTLCHIQNMLYFCTELPIGFRFTACDGTYGFLSEVLL